MLPDLRSTNRIFEEEVVAQKDFSALHRVYTRNARILPPGTEMVSGHEAIRSFWETAIAGLKVTSITLTTIEAEQTGDSVVEIGRAEMGISEHATPLAVKYVVVWKQEDGSWKWDIDIWNPVV